ncbi:hypothetical protein FRC10_000508 [Ceratobasidium sp. 414]|nr:hypothetical protein FRC10_000508 [Ceratobasidium sp. 414]
MSPYGSTPLEAERDQRPAREDSCCNEKRPAGIDADIYARPRAAFEGIKTRPTFTSTAKASSATSTSDTNIPYPPIDPGASIIDPVPTANIGVFSCAIVFSGAGWWVKSAWNKQRYEPIEIDTHPPLEQPERISYARLWALDLRTAQSPPFRALKIETPRGALGLDISPPSAKREAFTPEFMRFDAPAPSAPIPVHGGGITPSLIGGPLPSQIGGPLPSPVGRAAPSPTGQIATNPVGRMDRPCTMPEPYTGTETDKDADAPSSPLGDETADEDDEQRGSSQRSIAPISVSETSSHLFPFRTGSRPPPTPTSYSTRADARVLHGDMEIYPANSPPDKKVVEFGGQDQGLDVPSAYDETAAVARDVVGMGNGLGEGDVGKEVEVGKGQVEAEKEQLEVGKEWLGVEKERVEGKKVVVDRGMENAGKVELEDAGPVRADVEMEEVGPEKEWAREADMDKDKEVVAEPQPVIVKKKEPTSKSKASGAGSKPGLGGFKTNAKNPKSGAAVLGRIIPPPTKSFTPTIRAVLTPPKSTKGSSSKSGPPRSAPSKPLSSSSSKPPSLTGKVKSIKTGSRASSMDGSPLVRACPLSPEPAPSAPLSPRSGSSPIAPGPDAIVKEVERAKSVEPVKVIENLKAPTPPSPIATCTALPLASPPRPPTPPAPSPPRPSAPSADAGGDDIDAAL